MELEETKVTAARSTSKILEDKRSATISRRCVLAEISQKLADGTGRTKVTAARSTSKILEDKRSATISRRCLL
ncbi:hypothetical protein, partial [Brochothrix campestris]|uniref:hypothetical protein n=1 Tax=Brochothrix campestris TaxID=2757 RepID=UPI0012ECB710